MYGVESDIVHGIYKRRILLSRRSLLSVTFEGEILAAVGIVVNSQRLSQEK